MGVVVEPRFWASSEDLHVEGQRAGLAESDLKTADQPLNMVEDCTHKIISPGQQWGLVLHWQMRATCS